MARNNSWLLLVSVASVALVGCPRPVVDDSDGGGGADCSVAGCPVGEACVAATCRPTTCGSVPCPAGQFCEGGECRSAACVGVICPSGQVCAGGGCYDRSCTSVTCSTFAACVNGVCTSTACVGVVCPADQLCVAGACTSTRCGGDVCAAGSVCLNGACSDAVCLNVSCPGGTGCSNGLCTQSGCDGGTVDTQSDVQNCGACGRVCPAPLNSAAVCRAGSCGRSACSDGFFDLDGVPGCEATCTSNACTLGDGGSLSITARPIPETGLTQHTFSSGGAFAQTSAAFTQHAVLGTSSGLSADGGVSTTGTGTLHNQSGFGSAF